MQEKLFEIERGKAFFSYMQEKELLANHVTCGYAGHSLLIELQFVYCNLRQHVLNFSKFSKPQAFQNFETRNMKAFRLEKFS
jgi:hypothetical protein